jgi:hypothetical protein
MPLGEHHQLFKEGDVGPHCVFTSIDGADQVVVGGEAFGFVAPRVGL